MIEKIIQAIAIFTVGMAVGSILFLGVVKMSTGGGIPAPAAPEPLTCQENELLESIRELAGKGVHMQGYQLKIVLGNTPEGVWE